MMPIELVSAVKADIPLLYSMAREDFPGLTPDGWNSFAEPYIDEMQHGGLAGIVAAKAALPNNFRGFFLYSVTTTLQHPRTLVVPYTALPASFGREHIASLFVEEWHRLAARHGCGQIRLSLEPTIADEMLRLCGTAAAIETVCLCLAGKPGAAAGGKARLAASRPRS